MNSQLLPPPTEIARQSSAPAPPRMPRIDQAHVPNIPLRVLGLMLLIIAVAAFVSIVSGCGGNVLYAERFTSEQVEPAAEQWRALGAELDIVYGEKTPRGGDRIRGVRAGTLQAEGRNAESCEKTPTGGLVVWEGGSFRTRDLEIDLGCVESGRQTLTGILTHALGHYLGLEHLPEGEPGVMSGTWTDGVSPEHLTCADKREWAAFSGMQANCEATQ